MPPSFLPPPLLFTWWGNFLEKYPQDRGRGDIPYLKVSNSLSLHVLVNQSLVILKKGVWSKHSIIGQLNIVGLCLRFHIFLLDGCRARFVYSQQITKINYFPNALLSSTFHLRGQRELWIFHRLLESELNLKKKLRLTGQSTSLCYFAAGKKWTMMKPKRIW